MNDAYIQNQTFDEIAVGASASLERTLSLRDIQLFAAISGDVNPAHVDPEYARGTHFEEVIAHGLWGGTLISTLLGTELPGPGTIYVSQSLRFRRPVRLGDRVQARVEVTARDPEHQRLTLACTVRNQAAELVISGEAVVMAPSTKMRMRRWIAPDVQLNERRHLQRLMEAAGRHPAIRMAVVHPVEPVSLGGAIAARDAGLIVPILVGPEARIRAAGEQAGLDLSGVEIVCTEHSHAAADMAVALVREARADALMKGSLHTDELLRSIVDRQLGLRTERRMSHVFAFDVPSYPRPLLITDAAINIAPDLATKRDIVQNAIELAHALGVELPRVALLSAVETVTPTIPSTLDGAALCKMADRGQITGGILDGPLAFDNAVSEAAAATKGIVSEVAGRADILVVPDLESGNMLAKQLEYLAGAEGAGIVLGARVPVVLTSRADDNTSRVAACAIAVLLHQRQLAARA